MVQKIMVPPYFGPISCWKQIINSNILWDVHQNYIKQTFRNRTFIHSANGLQILTIPVKHSKIKFSMLDAKIDNSIAWQKNHWRSIESAYSSSPFFEFYHVDLDDNDRFFFIEFILWGLESFNKLSILRTNNGIEFKDPFNNFINKI